MANNKSIYDVYFEAGESAGEYEASKTAISGIWDEIGQSREDLAFEQQRISDTVDTLASALELGGEYFGSKAAQKEFESSDLPQTQKEIAKQQYEKGKVEGAPSWDELDKNERADIIAVYAPIKIGAGGREWDTYSTLDKLWEKPLYRFGGKDQDFVFKKSDVKGISQFSKYGMVPKIDAFKTSLNLYDEASKSGSPIVPPITPPNPAGAKTTTPGKGTTTTGFDFTKSAQGFKQRNQVPLYADWSSGQSELMKASKQLGWDESLKRWR